MRVRLILSAAATLLAAPALAQPQTQCGAPIAALLTGALAPRPAVDQVAALRTEREEITAWARAASTRATVGGVASAPGQPTPAQLAGAYALDASQKLEQAYYGGDQAAFAAARARYEETRSELVRMASEVRFPGGRRGTSLLTRSDPPELAAARDRLHSAQMAFDTAAEAERAARVRLDDTDRTGASADGLEAALRTAVIARLEALAAVEAAIIARNQLVAAGRSDAYRSELGRAQLSYRGRPDQLRCENVNPGYVYGLTAAYK